jgi:4-hydroxyacetophenone monooxygenase
VFELEPLPADDAEIRAALADAELCALVAACAHVTGDLSLLRASLRPDPLRAREPQAGYTSEQQAEAREVVAGALARLRDDLCRPGRRPTPSTAS